MAKWWQVNKNYKRYGVVGGMLYTAFALWWTYKGFDLTCNWLYPVQTGFECLSLIWVLTPSVFVLEGIGDITKSIIHDWTDPNSLYHIIGLPVGIIIFFIQGFLMGVLISVIIHDIRKKKK